MTQHNPAVEQILKKIVYLCGNEILLGCFTTHYIGIELLMFALNKKCDYFSEQGATLAVTHSGLLLYLEDNQVESNYLDYKQLGTYRFDLSLEENLEENSYLRDFAYYHLIETA